MTKVYWWKLNDLYWRDGAGVAYCRHGESGNQAERILVLHETGYREISEKTARCMGYVS